MLVFGGRDFEDASLAFETLDRVHAVRPIGLLVHGGASGADSLGGEWAERHGVPVRVFKADWKAFGKGAGPKRNQQMLDEAKPDKAVAFPGGKGTADMKTRATRAGIPVEEVSNG